MTRARVEDFPKGWWKVPGDHVWAPGLKEWVACTWARWVLYGGLRLRR